MCLVGMDIDTPEPDFVGFSIKVRRHGGTDFTQLRNRMNFAYDLPPQVAVNGFRNFVNRSAVSEFRGAHSPYGAQARRLHLPDRQDSEAT